MNVPHSAFLLLALAGIVACTNASLGPVIASSANQTTYAVRYPDALASARGAFAEQESRSSRLSGELSAYTADIDTKSWNHVSRAYQLSDEAGKSGAYAERYEQTGGITEFFTEEKDKLNQAVAGNVAYSAKQNNCKEPGEVAGTATHALSKAVDKQLQDRMRASNEAQAYIDAHADAIGTKSIEKLRDQVDTLAELSYTANIGVDRTRAKLQALLEESSKVRSTLDDAAKEAEAESQDMTQPEPDRKAAKARAEATRAAAARIDSEQQQGKFVLDEMQKRIEKIRSDYKQAVSGLLEQVKQKAADAPAPAAK